jgi:hypothetical protein
LKTLVALLLLGSAMTAQTPPVKSDLPEMVTDRPDFTESTEVVGKGVLQLEGGFTVERNHGVRNFSAPELLVRIGINKRLEFRIDADGFLLQEVPGIRNADGFSDVDLEAKIRLFDEGRYRPAVALIPFVSLPSGGAVFTSGGVDPTLKVALAKQFPKGFSLGGNVILSSLSTSAGRYFQNGLSASLGHSLGCKMDGFWEVFGFTPLDKGGTSAWIADTGITRPIGKNAQIDIRVGKNWTEAGPGWFWGLGLAFRHPFGR